MLFKVKGDPNFPKTDKWFSKLLKVPDLSKFEKYGRMGVEALARETPFDTGETARSWNYEIIQENGQVRVSFYNTNVNKGVNIAIILQYGHGTGTGGWVQGIDYINPAIAPVLEQLAAEAWEEVKNA